MQQIALFGSAADRFFLTLEEPPEELEMVVTEELYQVALESRLAHGEPDDYDHFDYQEQEAMRPPPAMIKTMGYDDGWNRRWPREPKDARYMLEYSWGEEQRRSEHRDNATVLIFESSGMSNYARRGRVGL